MTQHGQQGPPPEIGVVCGPKDDGSFEQAPETSLGGGGRFLYKQRKKDSQLTVQHMLKGR